jgi:endoglucanase
MHFPYRAGERFGSRLLFLFLWAAAFLFPAAMAHGADSAGERIERLAIKLDQVGYPLDGPKVALVSAAGTDFEIRRADDNKVVFHGKLTAAQADKDTGDQVRAADFSAYRKAGNYYLSVPGVGRSWDFSLGRNVFERTYYMAMRGFYGQRCGTAVDLGPEFPGYTHPACHLHGEFHPSSGAKGQRDNVGGWHDAGDYGRYVVNSGFATGTLLSAWEIFGDRIKKISLNIPESGNGTPDILNEARWNLEWMLKMQDDDGGVWHKQTSESFPGFIPPEQDTEPSKVIGTGSAPYKSTCATADLAAVGAIAARVYKPYDAKFAERALAAAERAWEWSEKFPNATFERNPPGIHTGVYDDNDCSDERLWAAAELGRATGEARYNDYFLKNYAGFLPSLDSPPSVGWGSVAPMGLWSYALSTRKEVDAKAVAAIRERTVAAARAVVAQTRANPYRVSLLTKDYVWGSNGVAASYGEYLLIADRFQPDPNFVDAARDDLHYLLGRNTFSLSWVTQVGENPFRHPHHRPSAAHPGSPWPGLLSGGPNAGHGDRITDKLPKDLPPAKVYADDQDSYTSNEIAINWQASLVFLLAGELP